MLTEKDYCDYDTCVALEELGFSSVNNEYFQSKIVSKEIPLKFFDTTLQGTSLEYAPIISLYEAQKWLREEKGIHIAPRIYLYHDINLDEQTSWECTIYVEWSAIYTIGKSLTYEDALLLGIKEAIKLLKNNQHECN